MNSWEYKLPATTSEAEVLALVDKLNKDLKLPGGYFVEWSGQYENLLRGQKTLIYILPIVFFIIFVITS